MVMPDFSEENLARLQAAMDFRCSPPFIQSHSPSQPLGCPLANSGFLAADGGAATGHCAGLGLLIRASKDSSMMQPCAGLACSLGPPRFAQSCVLSLPKVCAACLAYRPAPRKAPAFKPVHDAEQLLVPESTLQALLATTSPRVRLRQLSDVVCSMTWASKPPASSSTAFQRRSSTHCLTVSTMRVSAGQLQATKTGLYRVQTCLQVSLPPSGPAMFDHGFLTGSSLKDFREALDHAARQTALQSQLLKCSTCFRAARAAIFLNDYKMPTVSGVHAEPGDGDLAADNTQCMGSRIKAANEALSAEAAFVEEAEQW